MGRYPTRISLHSKQTNIWSILMSFRIEYEIWHLIWVTPYSQKGKNEKNGKRIYCISLLPDGELLMRILWRPSRRLESTYGSSQSGLGFVKVSLNVIKSVAGFDLKRGRPKHLEYEGDDESKIQVYDLMYSLGAIDTLMTLSSIPALAKLSNTLYRIRYLFSFALKEIGKRGFKLTSPMTKRTTPTADSGTEMDLLTHNGPNKHTRFQVNRVRNESHNAQRDGEDVALNMAASEDEHTDEDVDHDLHSVTDRTRLNSEHAKSFRNAFRELYGRDRKEKDANRMIYMKQSKVPGG
ncbi:hypothetical protein NQ315_016936 [Exocentrus adspersus]|uniref:Uncharacterized protein n=1 Tax=Exocentrus adspersus TaxID=1586481 RepID=A0AAV8VXT5_9CUCU|nr:hypothetical protein NQ315_016936 [Exocentrus adspersus]